MRLLKNLGFGFSEFKEEIDKENSATRTILSTYILNMQGFVKRISQLEKKIEILENETKTQDDIIFDMHKKIEKLEKSSWKGKKK